MARIRNVWPELFDDERLGACSVAARLCLIGLFTQADRAGRLEDRPQRLKARLFPYDREVDVAAVIDELATAGAVVRYQVADQAYLFLPTFADDQYLSKREPQSTLPGIDQAEPGPVPVLDRSSTSPVPVLDRSRKVLADGGRRTGDVGRGTRDMSPMNGDWRARFARFWDAYPRKVAKPAALKAFKALKVSEPMLDLMLSAIERQARSEAWREERGKFIPHPATWLHNARWDDEIEADPDTMRAIGPAYSADEPVNDLGESSFTECQRLHGGSCNGRAAHRLRLQVEAEKAAATA